MKFKEPHMEAQFNTRHPKLLEICQMFEELSLACGVEPVVTRVTDEVENESGVHRMGRAVDFRDEYADLKFLYRATQRVWICEEINRKYKRKDGRPTILHHKVTGSRAHFHVQLAADLGQYDLG